MAKPPTSETKTRKPAGGAEKPKKKIALVAEQPAAPIPIAKPRKVAKPKTAVNQPKAEPAVTPIPKTDPAKPLATKKASRKPAQTKPSSLRALAADILSGTVVPTMDQIKALAAGFGAGKVKKAKDKKKKK